MHHNLTAPLKGHNRESLGVHWIWLAVSWRGDRDSVPLFSLDGETSVASFLRSMSQDNVVQAYSSNKIQGSHFQLVLQLLLVECDWESSHQGEGDIHIQAWDTVESVVPPGSSFHLNQKQVSLLEVPHWVL